MSERLPEVSKLRIVLESSGITTAKGKHAGFFRRAVNVIKMELELNTEIIVLNIDGFFE